MAQRETRGQRKTVRRIMHEYKHGELPRGRAGGKVKSRKQAIAIALPEVGVANYASPKKNRASLRKTKAKERRGRTAQARAEGGKRATRSRRGPTRKTTARKTPRGASRRTSRKRR